MNKTHSLFLILASGIGIYVLSLVSIFKKSTIININTGIIQSGFWSFIVYYDILWLFIGLLIIMFSSLIQYFELWCKLLNNIKKRKSRED